MPTPRNQLIAELDEANRKSAEAIEKIKAAGEYRADGSTGASTHSAKVSTRFRKLQIAWTVAWVLTCLPLLVLWALSYSEVSRWDIQLGESGGINVWVMMGRLVTEPNIGPQQWETTRDPLEPLYAEVWDQRTARWNFGNNDRQRWTVPIWLPVMLSGALATVPWIPWSTRFSIRAILIITTLVAAVLGLIMYSLSK